MVKVLVLFYSTYRHLWQMAEAIAEGARQVEGAEVHVKRVPETLPAEVLEKVSIWRKVFSGRISWCCCCWITNWCFQWNVNEWLMNRWVPFKHKRLLNTFLL